MRAALLLVPAALSLPAPPAVPLRWTSALSLELELPGGRQLVALAPAPGAPCLWSGRLEGDPTSLAALSGCRHQRAVLSIASGRLPGGLMDLAIENGTAWVLRDEGEARKPWRQKREADYEYAYGDDYEDEVEEDLLIPPPNPFPIEGSWDGPLPREVTLTITAKYDRSLLGKFQGNHGAARQWIQRVTALAKPRLRHPSLKIAVRLEVAAIEALDVSVKADGRSIRKLARSNRDPRPVTVFCLDMGEGVLGIAYLNSACRRDAGLAMNIVEYYTDKDSEFKSAKVLAHELGHILGMKHDFARTHGGSGGRCDGKGLMSYDRPGRPPKPDSWSQCSNDDFDKWFREMGFECLGDKTGRNDDGERTTASAVVGGSSTCRTETGRRCVFPFTFRGQRYTGCTAVVAGRDWCATAAVATNSEWGYCAPACRATATARPAWTQPATQAWTQPTTPAPTTKWTTKGQKCVFPFTFQGRQYFACTTVSAGSLWCGTASIPSQSQWGYCRT